jgi:hypothetical protein
VFDDYALLARTLDALYQKYQFSVVIHGAAPARIVSPDDGLLPGKSKLKNTRRSGSATATAKQARSAIRKCSPSHRSS